MKENIPRILMLISGLLLIGLFIFPMWRITLIAPQYPEGITMFIYINKLGGDTPSTIQNINILNHYIGMKFIEPDSIPELKYFPYIVYGFIAMSFLFAWLNKAKLFLFWGALLILVSCLGIYDFYLWEYDYGHNLSENAPIKIPGASFQPPLFGIKEIINFTAISLPHISGVMAAFAILFSLIAWRLKLKIGLNEKSDSIGSQLHPDTLMHSVA